MVPRFDLLALAASGLMVVAGATSFSQDPAPVSPPGKTSPGQAELSSVSENFGSATAMSASSEPAQPPVNPYAGDLLTRLRLTGDW